MYSSLKIHILTKSTKFCEKNLDMIENIFFISVKNNNKTFCRKSFSVFGEAHGRPTLKLVLAKCFIITDLQISKVQ